MSKNWSQLQSNVFDRVTATVKNRAAIKRSRGKNAAILVRARAGTGKTTTAVETIIRLRKEFPGLRILFTVFANRNRADIEKKVVAAGLGSYVKGKYGERFQSTGNGALDIRTLNSLGLASLSSGWGKIRTVAGHSIDREIADMHLPPIGREKGQMKVKDRRGVEKLAHGAMAYLAENDEELMAVMHNEDLDIVWDEDEWPVSQMFQAVRNILKEYRRPRATVSFAHQVYSPAVEGMKYGNYDVVIVDESQDQSPAKLRLCELALAPDGVMVSVGDDAQAIFGFAGADSQSIANYVEKWEPEILPLSITYRCPKVVVESVRWVAPDYEAHPSAPEGEIIEADVDMMHRSWKLGDVCISRTNAPLIRHCLAAWRLDMRAMILGRDFADDLKKMIRNSDADTVIQFLTWLGEYVMTETERLMAAKRPEQIEKLADIEETFVALCEGLTTIQSLNERLDKLFADDPKGDCLLFSSTHRFKGGEAERIWMFRDTYKPTFMEYKVGDTIRAEDCLFYVACTRTMGVAGKEGSGKLFMVPVKNTAARAEKPKTEGDVVEPPLKVTVEVTSVRVNETAPVEEFAGFIPAPLALLAPTPAPRALTAPKVAPVGRRRSGGGSGAMLTGDAMTAKLIELGILKG